MSKITITDLTTTTQITELSDAELTATKGGTFLFGIGIAIGWGWGGRGNYYGNNSGGCGNGYGGGHGGGHGGHRY